MSIFQSLSDVYWRNIWNWSYRLGLYDPLVPSAYDASLQAAAQALDLGPGERVTDAGCGSGRLLVHLRDSLVAGQCQLTGLDASPAGLAAARRRSQRLGLGDRASFLLADFRKPLPLPEASQDKAVAHFSLYVWPDRQQRRSALSNLACVLKPGGRLVVAVPGQNYSARQIVQKSQEIDQSRGISAWQRFFNRWVRYRYTFIFEQSVERRIARGLWCGYTEQELREDVSSAGFRVERVSDTYGGTSILLSARRDETGE